MERIRRRLQLLVFCGTSRPTKKNILSLELSPSYCDTEVCILSSVGQASTMYRRQSWTLYWARRCCKISCWWKGDWCRTENRCRRWGNTKACFHSPNSPSQHQFSWISSSSSSAPQLYFVLAYAYHLAFATLARLSTVSMQRPRAVWKGSPLCDAMKHCANKQRYWSLIWIIFRDDERDLDSLPPSVFYNFFETLPYFFIPYFSVRYTTSVTWLPQAANWVRQIKLFSPVWMLFW